MSEVEGIFGRKFDQKLSSQEVLDLQKITESGIQSGIELIATQLLELCHQQNVNQELATRWVSFCLEHNNLPKLLTEAMEKIQEASKVENS